MRDVRRLFSSIGKAAFRIAIGLLFFGVVFTFGCSGPLDNYPENDDVTYSLTITISPDEAGSIAAEPAQDGYEAGTEVELTASASGGYSFDCWSGDLSGTESTASITMDSDMSVTASFLKDFLAGDKWSKTYGESGRDYPDSIAAVSADKYVVSGWTDSFGSASGNLWVLTLSGTGDLLSEETFTYCDDVNLLATADGGYLFAGTTSEGTGSSNPWVVKYDSSGNKEWNTYYEAQTTSYSYFITDVKEAAGGYVLAGREHYNLDYDAFIMKTSTDGSIVWQKVVNNTTYDDYITGITEINSGDFIAVGNHESNAASIYQFNASGVLQWVKEFNGSSFDTLQSVDSTGDGGYIVLGYSNSFSSSSGMDFWVIKFSSTHSIEWQKRYYGADGDEAFEIIAESDGTYTAAGYTGSFDTHGGTDLLLVKLAGDGSILWQKMYGGTSYDSSPHFTKGFNNEYIIAANTESFGVVNEDVWVLRTDNTGLPVYSSDTDGVYLGFDASLSVLNVSAAESDISAFFNEVNAQTTKKASTNSGISSAAFVRTQYPPQ